MCSWKNPGSIALHRIKIRINQIKMFLTKCDVNIIGVFKNHFLFPHATNTLKVGSFFPFTRK